MARAPAVHQPGLPFGPWADVDMAQWLDWRWQLQHRLRSSAELSTVFALRDDQRRLVDGGQAFEVGITPWFASLCQTADSDCPLVRQVLPDPAELAVQPFERADPLGEDPHRKAPGLVHKYPDRVLLLVTERCAAYCRYCTRARWVASGSEHLGQDELDAAVAYIAATPAIRDVLVSGGDPLLLSSARLEALLDRLAAIPHLRFIRLGTRVPIFLPMRIDAALVRALRPRRIPIYVNVHCNHFRELPPQTCEALAMLADGGVPLGGQAVLLRGVNDDAATLRDTFYAMLGARVRPYYLFHCDPIRGSAHLRTTVSRGLELMEQLVGWTSGMAVPKYCIDLEGAGKVPMWPAYVEQIDDQAVRGRSYRGEPWQYDNRAGDDRRGLP
jgi:lysine 2,3-aminomutase